VPVRTFEAHSPSLLRVLRLFIAELMIMGLISFGVTMLTTTGAIQHGASFYAFEVCFDSGSMNSVTFACGVVQYYYSMSMQFTVVIL
jgi:hypothetical protein